MVGSAGIVIAWIELSGGTACDPSRPSFAWRARLAAERTNPRGLRSTVRLSPTPTLSTITTKPWKSP